MRSKSCCQIICHLFFMLLLPLTAYSATTKTAGTGIAVNQLLKFDATGKVVPTTLAADQAIGVALQTRVLNQSIAVETTDDVNVLSEVGVLSGQFLLPSATTAGAVAGSATFVQGVFAVAQGAEVSGLVKAHFLFGFPVGFGSGGGLDADTVDGAHRDDILPLANRNTLTFIDSILDSADAEHSHTHSGTTGQTVNDHHTQIHVISGADHTGSLAHTALSGVTSDLHHAKLHIHDGLDGSGTVTHANTTGKTANDHHTQIHTLSGTDHTGLLGGAQLPANVALLDAVQSFTADQTFTTEITLKENVIMRLGNADEFSIVFSSLNTALNISPIAGDGVVAFTSIAGAVDILLDGDFFLEDGNLLLDDLVGNTLDFVLGATNFIRSSNDLNLQVGTNGFLVAFGNATAVNDPKLAVGGWGTSALVFGLVDVGTVASNNNVKLSSVNEFMILTDGAFEFENSNGKMTLDGKTLLFATNGESIDNDTNNRFDFNFLSGVTSMTKDRYTFGLTEFIDNSVENIVTVGTTGGNMLDIDFTPIATVEINSDTEFLQLRGSSSARILIKTDAMDFLEGNIVMTGGAGKDDINGWSNLLSNTGALIVGTVAGEFTFLEAALGDGLTLDMDGVQVSIDATTPFLHLSDIIELPNNERIDNVAADDKVRIVEDLGVKFLEVDLTGVAPLLTSNTGVVKVAGLDHADLTNVTSDQHHAQVHAIDGADHTGTLDDNEITTLFTGTTFLDGLTNQDATNRALDTAIAAVTTAVYFSGVDVVGGIDVSAGWTDVTLDTEHAKAGITHIADSAVVTIVTTGVYVVSYHLTLDDSNDENQGYTGEGRLMLNTGAGFAEVSGTRTAFVSFFDPSDATPMGTCSMSVILSLTATDTLKLQGQQNPISSDTGILTNPDGCGLTIHLL